MPKLLIDSSRKASRWVVLVIVLISFQFLVLAQVSEKSEISSPKPEKAKASATIDITDIDVSSDYLFEFSGTSSHYAKRFHNRRTACGEKFDLKGFTAAHRKLPFGTIIRVSNEVNGKSVLVRINDRGPHSKNRILDLAPGAAKQIDGLGLPQVKVEGFVRGAHNIVEKFDKEYYYGYSLDVSPICVPGTSISVIDSVENFDEALKIYYRIRSNSGQDNTFIFVKADVPEAKGQTNYYVASLSKRINFARLFTAN